MGITVAAIIGVITAGIYRHGTLPAAHPGVLTQ